MTPKEENNENRHPGLSWRGLFVVLCGFSAAWISAGSVGLLAHSLRKALTLLLLGIIILFVPLSSRRRHDIIWRSIGIVLAVWMITSKFLPINILAVAVLLSCLSIGLYDLHPLKQALLLTSSSVAILGIYRLTCISIPSVWLAFDSISKFLGLIAGSITRKPLWVGLTFGGLDFLIPLFAFLGSWLVYSRIFRLKNFLIVTSAILASHLIYLVILSASITILKKFPEKGLIWYLPQLAGYIHLLVAGIIIKHLSWPTKQDLFKKWNMYPRWITILLVLAGLISASVLAALTTLCRPLGSIRDRKVVIYEHGFLNWLKPQHGEYGRFSIGMYGMLPIHIKGLGGRCVVSPDLSESDLADAKALILLYPNEPWPEGMLDRIWKFVEDGGSLLVMGEHTVKESDGGNRFNDVLEPTSMRVRFDSATFAVGGWLHSYQPLSHPAFIGIDDDRNLFGVVIGASVDTHWPARPLLIGHWGWADPGDENGPAMMGNGEYDPGERLGDLILAAEQRFGKGRIIVFGDTSGITNGILIDSHPFVYRLLSYLANQEDDYQPVWRQFTALIFAVSFLLMLICFPGIEKTICMLGLAIGLILCLNQGAKNKAFLPDGRLARPNNLAYIDSSHLPLSSEESWREDGTMGLMLNLMRSGYLTLSMPELIPERLERAGILVLIAPRRYFTKDERDVIYDYVYGGGILICTAGYEDYEPIRLLLSDFGFDIGLSECDPSGTRREPQPLGHFKSPYFNAGEYMTYVRYHAAWPITCIDPKSKILAYGRGEVPVIILRNVGLGKVVLIGDTCFAMNKNLEHQDGSPFEGMRENAHFWRWFITVLRGESMWIPPNEYNIRKGVS